MLLKVKRHLFDNGLVIQLQCSTLPAPWHLGDGRQCSHTGEVQVQLKVCCHFFTKALVSLMSTSAGCSQSHEGKVQGKKACCMASHIG